MIFGDKLFVVSLNIFDWNWPEDSWFWSWRLAGDIPELDAWNKIDSDT